MSKITVPNSEKKMVGLTRSAHGLLALEPRFMFDGAAVDVALDVVTHSDPVIADAHPMFDVAASSMAALSQPLQQVQAQVRNAVANWTDASWMEVFGIKSSDAKAIAALQEVLHQIQDGTYRIHVVEVSSSEMGLSMAAFAAKGPDDRPTVFLNRDWWSGTGPDV